jgi:hypothetical protein
MGLRSCRANSREKASPRPPCAVQNRRSRRGRVSWIALRIHMAGHIPPTREGSRMTVSRTGPVVLIVCAHDGGGYHDYLCSCGFRVLEAHSGSEALARAGEALPDLIVLDYGLNSEVVDRLRADTTTATIPIIALTTIATLYQCRRH